MTTTIDQNLAALVQQIEHGDPRAPLSSEMRSAIARAILDADRENAELALRVRAFQDAAQIPNVQPIDVTPSDLRSWIRGIGTAQSAALTAAGEEHVAAERAQDELLAVRLELIQLFRGADVEVSEDVSMQGVLSMMQGFFSTWNHSAVRTVMERLCRLGVNLAPEGLKIDGPTAALDAIDRWVEMARAQPASGHDLGDDMPDLLLRVRRLVQRYVGGTIDKSMEAVVGDLDHHLARQARLTARLATYISENWTGENGAIAGRDAVDEAIRWIGQLRTQMFEQTAMIERLTSAVNDYGGEEEAHPNRYLFERLGSREENMVLDVADHFDEAPGCGDIASALHTLVRGGKITNIMVARAEVRRVLGAHKLPPYLEEAFGQPMKRPEPTEELPLGPLALARAWLGFPSA